MTENKDLALLTLEEKQQAAMEKAARLKVTGDLSKMTMVEKASFLSELASAYGLMPFPPPFELIPGKNGKEIIYANKSCTDQLRKVYGVSVKIIYAGPLMIGDQANTQVYIVRAEATDKNGRTDEAIGSVSLAGLGPEEIANYCMRAETKAKRRVTLSICGLSFLDESEVVGQSWNGNRQPQVLSGPRQINPMSLPNTTSTQPVINATIVESKLEVGEEPLPPIGVK